MHDYLAAAERYIAAWNATDSAIREAAVAAAFAPEASFVDPMMSGQGHDGLQAMIAGVQGRFSGLVFRLEGEPQGHGANLRFSWSLGPADGEALARGTDFAELAPDGRLARVTGFFDLLPEAA